jgi:hypothetical protein
VGERATESKVIQHDQSFKPIESTKVKVLNLSKRELTPGQVSLLVRGPKFCPTTKGNATDFCGDSYAFGRRLELHEIFFGISSNDNSLIRKPSHKYITSKVKELTNITATIRKIQPTKIHTPCNIANEEVQALRELKILIKSDLEIKKADKSNTLVVMDKDEYRNQLVHNCHLETSSYERVSENSDKLVYNNLKKLCLKHDSCLTKNEKDAILDKDWTTSNFYALPKINKSLTILHEISNTQQHYLQIPMPPDLKSRPIVSGPKSVTKGISKLLEKILTPLVAVLRSYIKNEGDFLRKFPKNIGKDSYIVCCDVISLYTSIPHELGLQAIEYWIDKHNNLIPSRFTKDFIMEGTCFVLENNYMNFDDGCWRQKVGTAMGKEVASPYACLTVGFLEETILFPRLIPARFDLLTAQSIIKCYSRFVDDGITPIPRIVPAVEFQDLLNQMDPSVQFTVTEPTITEENSNV